MWGEGGGGKGGDGMRVGIDGQKREEKQEFLGKKRKGTCCCNKEFLKGLKNFENQFNLNDQKENK